MDPVISVFMPIYNQAAFIDGAVENVMKQETKYHLEKIICDDFCAEGRRGMDSTIQATREIQENTANHVKVSQRSRQ